MWHMTLWRCYYYTYGTDKRLNHQKKKKNFSDLPGVNSEVTGNSLKDPAALLMWNYGHLRPRVTGKKGRR